jgi:putative drug exporter of the RND superfamily
MGYGGMLIPLVSTVVAITLLPVVLATVGPRLDWPHRRTDDKASRAWTRWAAAVSRRRWMSAGAGLLVILALAGASLGLKLGESDASTIAKAGSAKAGLDALVSSGIGEGALAPHEILVDGATSPAKVAAAVGDVDGVYGAIAPDAWRRGGSALVDAIPVPDGGSDAGGATLAGVRDAAHASGADVRVGGGPASTTDFIDVFGLSMDYEVFILARMREEYDRTGSTETAVVQGIGRTGRLVTSAALILFLTFTSMASGPETDVKMLATALAAGILIDATIIRALIVPAVISLMGRWNWWLPRWSARILRVEPSPALSG